MVESTSCIENMVDNSYLRHDETSPPSLELASADSLQHSDGVTAAT